MHTSTINKLHARLVDKLAALSGDKRELIVRSATAFVAKIISAALALVLTAQIARALGAHEAGYYFWALALITVLATLSRAGWDQVLLRFMSAAIADRNERRAYSIFRYGMRRTLCIAIAIAGVTAGLSPLLAQLVFNDDAVAPLIALMGFGGVFLALNTLQSQSFLADRRVLTSIFILEIGVPLMMVALVFAAAPHSGKTVGLFYLAASALMVVAFSGYWRRRANAETEPLVAEERAKIQRVRSHLFGVAALSLVAQWGGVILLGWFASPAEVALFSVALRIAMINSFILRAVNAVVGSRFAESYHLGDIEGLRRLALQSSRLMTLAAIPILVFLLLCMKPLLEIFGADFAAAADCLVILSLGQFINVVTGAVCLLLEMTGGEAQLRRFETISAASMLILGFILIPMFGAVGAAIATAISVASVNFLAVLEVKRRFGFNMLKIW